MALRIVLGVVVVLALASTETHADRSVFLNGVELSNVEVGERQFSGCKVRFDVAGNVHIEVVGFEIGKRKVAPTVPPRRAPRTAAAQTIVAGGLTGRFFVASKGAVRGTVQLDVEVYVNNRLVKRVRPGERDGVVEITQYVRAGKNRIRVRAAKARGSAHARRSHSPTDQLEVTVGEGAIDNGVVSIVRSIVTYRRNASERGRFDDRYSFVVER